MTGLGVPECGLTVRPLDGGRSAVLSWERDQLANHPAGSAQAAPRVLGVAPRPPLRRVLSLTRTTPST
ncbi:hypothetical protein [Fodinicola feengrottensis]|uniref:hypothetical protein n=1 Tax=Fodinicola feengrottensis TaxID=435914 RepID=UPI0013D1E7BE|nr:hypothetical protein [Fodinicola feengrottensis]